MLCVVVVCRGRICFHTHLSRSFLPVHCTLSLFDMHIALRHLPFLPWVPPAISNKLMVMDVMRHRPICLRKRERVGVIYDLLTQCTHNGFPVIDQHPSDPDTNRFVVSQCVCVCVCVCVVFRTKSPSEYPQILLWLHLEAPLDVSPENESLLRQRTYT